MGLQKLGGAPASATENRAEMAPGGDPAPEVTSAAPEAESERDGQGDRGRLAATGFAFGAAPWRGLLGRAPPRTPAGPALVLGARKPREAALLAALADYPGAVILIDHNGLADRLARTPLHRFAPGAGASIRHDPLACIRPGLDSWRDLVLLARALCGDPDDPHTEGVAALLADHVIAAPPEQRSLADLRRRLFDVVETVRAVMLGYAGPPPAALTPLLAELERIKPMWLAQPLAAHAAAIHLSNALIGWSDGRIAAATAARDLDFAELVCGDEPATLVLAPPVGVATEAAPILSAIVSQALSAIIEAQDQTKPVQHRVALVIPDVTAFKAPPLLRQLWRDLGRCGVDVLVGAERLFDLHSFLGERAMTQLTERDPIFTSITAVGSMGEDDADLLSARSGKAWGFGRAYPIEAGLSVFGWGWRKRPRIAARRLEQAGDGAAWTIGDGDKPRLMRIASASVVTMTQAAPGVSAPPAPLWTLPAPPRLKLAALMAQATGRTGARANMPDPQPDLFPTTSSRPPRDIRAALNPRQPRPRRRPAT